MTMTKTKRYYEYRHYPGYGRDDHMADEVIARAAPSTEAAQ